MNWSAYQEAIFTTVPDLLAFKENLIVQAVAGSGKSTTIVEIFKILPQGKSAIFVAFNKHIADALKAKGLNASTLHSLGMAAIRENYRGRVTVDADKVKKILQWEIYNFKTASPKQKKEFYSVLNPICKLISLCKGYGYTDSVLVENLIERHGIEVPNVPDFYQILDSVWTRSKDQMWRIDFDDMLYLPIANGWRFTQYDLVCVDESQDLNPIQMNMISKIAKTAIFVGDSGQAIYGFRGADPDSMDNIQRMFACRELPLSICYRCPKKVIEAAQEYVPQIEAAPNAEEGIVETITEETYNGEIAEGDYVLCRTTAPLVSRCLNLIANGRYARVLGREIGAGLVSLVQDLFHGPIEGFFEALYTWASAEADKCKKKDKDTTNLDDKVSCLKALATTVKTTDELIVKINEIFSDTEARQGITFATIHKAKGLEGDRIFILHPELLPHPKATLPWQQQQERNLAYVAVTRARKELYWVKCKEIDE